LILIGSGVYQFKGKKTKGVRFRGFSNLKNVDLWNLLEEHEDKTFIEIPQESALSLGRYLISYTSDSPYRLNQFVKFNKRLNINFDAKRLWLDEFPSNSAVLTERHRSLTLKTNNTQNY